MSRCPGCGGIVGQACWNPVECEWISRDMERRAAADDAMYQREYEQHEREEWLAMEREELIERAADGLLDRSVAS